MSNPNKTTYLPGCRVLVPSVVPGLRAEELPGLRALAVEPLAVERLEFLDAVATAIRKHPRLGREPAAAAVAFWLRRSNLQTLAREFAAREGQEVRVAAGLALHITPANVDTMFLYSWAISFLAGNANIVRLTTRLSPLMLDLLSCLDTVATAQPAAWRGNYFVAYEHDAALSAAFSEYCDQRVVWGGNETVRRLRAVPLNPHAGERCFASKRSLALIAVSAYAALDNAARAKLADRMAVDIAPFGQLACASPQVVCWLGEADVSAEGRAAFAHWLETALAARQGAPDLGFAVNRLNTGFAAAAAGQICAMTHQPHETDLQALSLALAEQEEPCGGGLLMHVACRSVAELAAALGPAHQTVTHFGFVSEQVRDVARLLGRRGVDRLVPIGQALDFTASWDGFDLWDDFTRQVTVR